MYRIKKDDTVQVLAGKDKGKSGKVIKIITERGTALVQGVNFVSKHTKKSQKDPQGGIIHKESPVNISNIGIVCKSCQKPVKVGIRALADGTKTRFCRRCKEVLS